LCLVSCVLCLVSCVLCLVSLGFVVSGSGMGKEGQMREGVGEIEEYGERDDIYIPIYVHVCVCVCVCACVRVCVCVYYIVLRIYTRERLWGPFG
jgi:ABC-type Fe3+ transport system permease subunit